jgi:nucleoside-diphosphate-sugar epimerase
VKALVVGGTGPSGPYLVNGLLQRGYDVTVLHGGHHEVDFIQPVEHIHTDPHFAETLALALEGRRFDLAIATYGRLRIIADLLKGKTDRFIAVGAGVYAEPSDPRWGPLGPPVVLSESDGVPADDPNGSRMVHLIWQTEQAILQAHREGHYHATYMRYPTIYGPNAPANLDWSVVRRLLDGRKQIILADGGAMVWTRADGENAAHAVLLAVDKPEASAGQVYNVSDADLYTERQRVSYIIQLMGVACEIVDMPQALARRASKSFAWPGNRVRDIHKIRTELGYRDVISPADALKRAVEWLIAHPFERGGEAEQQIGDPFDYAAEDALIRVYRAGLAQAAAVRFPEVASGHMYRHPRVPGEAWAPRRRQK